MSDGCLLSGAQAWLEQPPSSAHRNETGGQAHKSSEYAGKCSLLEYAAAAFCVIELVFNEDGRGVGFHFSLLQCGNGESGGVPVEEMLNRSFYEVFRNGDKKRWTCVLMRT